MTRWNVSVSSDIDITLRMFLADQEKVKNSNLSRFIEEAVRARIFELTARETKKAMFGLDERETTTLVNEALDLTRRL